MSSLGLTRKKAILIGVLASALAYLLVWQPVDPEAPPVDSPATAGERPSRRSSPNGDVAAVSASWTPAWSNLSLEETLARNPFTPLNLEQNRATVENLKPAASAPPTVAVTDADEDAGASSDAEQEAALIEFQRLGVTMILKHKADTCAVVGGRLVHAGDVIDGVRIVTITSSEVIVEPASESR